MESAFGLQEIPPTRFSRNLLYHPSQATARICEQGDTHGRYSRPAARPKRCSRAHQANVQFKTLGSARQARHHLRTPMTSSSNIVALLRGKHGDAVGYKVGLTSAAMQTFCGIDHPIARRRAREAACIDRARACGARITGGWVWNSKSRFASNRTCRPRRAVAPPRRSRRTSAASARRSKWSTIAAPTMPASMCCRWWRTIPGTPASCCRNFRRNGPIWRARSGAPEGRCRDRRRLRPRHPRPSLQFGRLACHAAGFAGRGTEGRPGRDDRQPS